MYIVILYVTLCMSGIDECHAQEPITWTADEAILQETAQICSALAESVTVDAGEDTVATECHIIGPDERDRHVDQ